MKDEDWKIKKRPEDFLNKKYSGLESMHDIGNRVLQWCFNAGRCADNPNEYALHGNQRWYREVYLKSHHWREVRTEAICEAVHKCRRCGISDDEATLDVHHLTYERLGFENPDDVIVLC